MQAGTSKVALVATTREGAEKAQQLASCLKLPLITEEQRASYPFILAITPIRVELQAGAYKKFKPLYVDFLAPSLRYRLSHGGRGKELLARAVGLKSGLRPSVVDLTAGFGVDAFVLSSLGCQVVLVERAPVVGALLQDGLERLENQGKRRSSLTLYVGQAREYLAEIQELRRPKPEVIYLDPLYAERSKSALGTLKLRVLQKLVGSDSDAAELLALAVTCSIKRVVVKRLKLASPLGLVQPELQLFSGGSCRYDIYWSRNI